MLQYIDHFLCSFSTIFFFCSYIFTAILYNFGNVTHIRNYWNQHIYPHSFHHPNCWLINLDSLVASVNGIALHLLGYHLVLDGSLLLDELGLVMMVWFCRLSSEEQNWKWHQRLCWLLCYQDVDNVFRISYSCYTLNDSVSSEWGGRGYIAIYDNDNDDAKACTGEMLTTLIK